MTTTRTNAYLYSVCERIQARGRAVPSVQTGAKAARIAESDKISSIALPTRVYHAEGDHGRYLVALTMASPERDAEIITGVCSCPSGMTGATCSHLLAVLTLAAAEGNHLKASTEEKDR